MYIWCGCLLPEEFEKELRSVCTPLARELPLDTVPFSLPQHISIKISFPYDGETQVLLDCLTELLKHQPPFTVCPGAIERQGNILWIPFGENSHLRYLHNLLDCELNKVFDVPQHIFDKAFQFHSTLFFGPEEALEQARLALRSFAMPQALTVSTIVLGVSKTGKAGTYRVVRRIPLSGSDVSESIVCG